MFVIQIVAVRLATAAQQSLTYAQYIILESALANVQDWKNNLKARAADEPSLAFELVLDDLTNYLARSYPFVEEAHFQVQLQGLRVPSENGGAFWLHAGKLGGSHWYKRDEADQISPNLF